VTYLQIRLLVGALAIFASGTAVSGRPIRNPRSPEPDQTLTPGDYPPIG
jgi:hypothetical protein